MTPQFDVHEVPLPSHDPDSAVKVALFTLQHLYHEDKPDTALLDMTLDDMERQTTVAAYDVDGQVLAVAGIRRGVEQSSGKIVDVASISSNRKAGLGRAVVQYAEQVAYGQGMRRLELFSFPSAVGFYEKLGYVKDRCHPANVMIKVL